MGTTETLNLLSFCRRAIGEWPAINPVQGQLINIEKNFPLLKPNNELLATKKIVDPGSTSWYFDPSEIPRATLENLKCTKLTVIEKMDITEHHKSVQEVVTFDKFVKHGGAVYPKGYNKAVIDSLDMKDRQKLYWATKLKDMDSATVMGILSAIPALIKKGFKYWELPTGDKVPLKSLKLLALDVAPNIFYMTRILRYEALRFQGTMALRELENEASADHTPNIFIRRIVPEVGAVFLYCVLGVHVPSSNGLYVVDPTSLQYGNEGPKQSLIMHGWWEKYEEKFPGKILLKGDYEKEEYAHTVARMNEMGEGPRRFVTRLGSNLVTYLDRKSCNHCGIVEGVHHERPRPDWNYNRPPVVLFNCGKCKKVVYCGKTCQVINWPGHKKTCKSIA